MLLALARPVASSYLYSGSRVVELNTSTFYAYTGNVTAGQVTVVEAYASWCPHCQRMAPAYRRFAQEAEPWAPAVRVAALDCMLHDSLCRELSVYGYPTLFLFGDLRAEAARLIGQPASGAIRVRHEGAFAEGYPAHAIHELWQWTLSWARSRAQPVPTAAALQAAKQAAHASGLALTFVIRSKWDPAETTADQGALGATPPPPLAPMPIAPPPSAASRLDGWSPPPASAPPAPLDLAGLDSAADAARAATDACAGLRQPDCLAQGCEAVIDCWNAMWPSTCQWWHERDGWAYAELLAAGCPCRCRSPDPPPAPSPPRAPPRAPPSPPAPPGPPVVRTGADGLAPAQQAHLVAQLCYELQPMAFAEHEGTPSAAFFQSLGFDGADSLQDSSLPVIAVAPADGSAPSLYPFDAPRFEPVAEWLAAFQGGRRRGGLPSTSHVHHSARSLIADSGQIISAARSAELGAPAAWPLPAAELRAAVLYTLQAFPFAGRDCLEADAREALAAWLSACARWLGFDERDTSLLELLAAESRGERLTLCLADWVPLLSALRASGFGAPHNLGGGSSGCARGAHALTCTLWVAFHSMVAGAQGDAEAALALRAVDGFVHHFFACRECVAHWDRMAAPLKPWLEAAPRSHAELALWLWRAHNTVALRVALMDASHAAARLGQPARDAVWAVYPSPFDCPACLGGARELHTTQGYFAAALDASCPLPAGSASDGAQSAAADARSGGGGGGGGGGGAKLGALDDDDDGDLLEALFLEAALGNTSARRRAADGHLLARAPTVPCDDRAAAAIRYRPEAVRAFLLERYRRPKDAPRERPPSRTIEPPRAAVVPPGRTADAANAAAAAAAAAVADGVRAPAAGGATSTAPLPRELETAAAAPLATSGVVRPFGQQVGAADVRRFAESERASPLPMLVFVGLMIGAAAVASRALRRRVDAHARVMRGLPFGGRGGGREALAQRSGDGEGSDDDDTDGALGGGRRRGARTPAGGAARRAQYGELRDGGRAGDDCEVELSSRPVWDVREASAAAKAAAVAPVPGLAPPSSYLYAPEPAPASRAARGGGGGAAQPKEQDGML